MKGATGRLEEMITVTIKSYRLVSIVLSSCLLRRTLKPAFFDGIFIYISPLSSGIHSGALYHSWTPIIPLAISLCHTFRPPITHPDS
jgi:hypothetical protein